MVTQGKTDLSRYIRSVPDFPKPGINFKDITTLLKDAAGFREALSQLHDQFKNGPTIAKVVSIESRGFIFGGALAHLLGAGFVPARKPGKLPAKTVRQEYELEYGKDCVEMHADALERGENVLLHDDLLATGGTAAAACKLIEKLGARIVGVSFLIELTFLKGRERLKPYDVFSLVRYESEGLPPYQ
ncbi:MAG TPA: adenine phosphoribosyltransferase [Bacteroidota bacterium]